MPRRLTRFVSRRFQTVVLAWLLAGSAAAQAPKTAELADCREMIARGQFHECIDATFDAISKRRYGESWPVLKSQAELATGQYRAVLQTVEQGIERYSWSVRLRWNGRKAALNLGNDLLADQRLAEIVELVSKFPWRYTDAEEIVVLGEIDLLLGLDARDVLDKRLFKARDRNRRSREPWLAIA